MRRRRLLLFLLAGVVVGVVIFLAWPRERELAWPRQREPEYNGRKLSQWTFVLAADSRSSTPGRLSFHHEASEAVAHMGTNGLPWVLAWIRHDPRPWKTKLYAFTSKLPRPFTLQPPPPFEVEGAWHYLHVLGARASPAIPELSRLMNDATQPARAKNAAAALASIGPAAIPSFAALLDNLRAPNRAPMVYHLCMINDLGTNASRVVALLVRCLNDPDDLVAFQAAWGMGYLAANPEVAVPALANALQNPSQRVRYEAAVAIVNFGEQASPAVPALLKAQSDTDESVRTAAANALRKIAPEVFPEFLRGF